MNFLFITGLVLLGLGIIGLFSQPKTDKRTKTGIKKGKTTSLGLCLILIITGAGSLYIDSKFFSEKDKRNLSSESQNQKEIHMKSEKKPITEKSNTIRNEDY